MNFTQDINDAINDQIIGKVKATHRYAKLTFILVVIILIGNFTISGLFGYLIYEKFDELKHHTTSTTNVIEHANEAIDIINQFKN
jgi:hypothetical protein